MIPASSSRYSLSWAQHVVSQLRDRYPRGLKAVYELLQITSQDLAKYLARSDPLWPHLRELARALDNWHRTCTYGYNWVTDVKGIRFFCTRKHWERIVRRIDMLHFDNTIKEQESAGSPEPSGEGSPSFFPALDEEGQLPLFEEARYADPDE